jgi:hypothetical protein
MIQRRGDIKIQRSLFAPRSLPPAPSVALHEGPTLEDTPRAALRLTPLAEQRSIVQAKKGKPALLFILTRYTRLKFGQQPDLSFIRLISVN